MGFEHLYSLSYEPIHSVRTGGRQRNNETMAEARNLVSSLMKCEYNDNVARYLRSDKKYIFSYPRFIHI